MYTTHLISQQVWRFRLSARWHTPQRPEYARKCALAPISQPYKWSFQVLSTSAKKNITFRKFEIFEKKKTAKNETRITFRNRRLWVIIKQRPRDLIRI